MSLITCSVYVWLVSVTTVDPSPLSEVFVPVCDDVPCDIVKVRLPDSIVPSPLSSTLTPLGVSIFNGESAFTMSNPFVSNITFLWFAVDDNVN